MNTSYYVWYRVQGDVVAARSAVDRILHDVYANAGLLGRVMVRRDDPRTWMEVYEGVADTTRFEEALTAAALRHEAARWVEGGNRHLEPFIAF